MSKRPLQACGILVCLATLIVVSGCVERRLYLRSDPPGANVTVNGKDIGMTPVKMPFITYGDYDIVMSAPDHQRLQKVVSVEPPWWETIFLDFFIENVCPWTVTDEHDISLKLQPLAASDESGVDQREKALRDRMQAGEDE